MALTITVTDKATRAVTTVVGQEVSLSTPSVVLLPIPRAQIKSLAREGNDLVITTVNGETIVVHGFLADDQTGDQASQTSQAAHNDLVFQDENGGLWLTDWSDLSALPVDTSIDPVTAAGGAGAFSPVESMDALLGTSDASSAAALVGGADDVHNWLPPTYALAGFATALAAAASLGGTSPSTKLNKPIVNHNPDGTLTVSGGPGATDPGNSITVTFPDNKSQKTVTANADGSYSVTSETPQDNGHGNVTATKPGMDSSSQGYDYSFKTPQPKIDSVTDNANGTVTVSGSADPGSKVTVVFSDGTSSKSGTAGSDGKFTIDSDTIQPTGTLTATATDQAGGHASDPLVKDYTQSAGVQITSISPDTAFPDGGSPVYGTSQDYITHAKGGAGDPLKVSGTVNTGKLDSGGKVQISIDGGNWTDVSSLNSSAGTWYYDLTSGLSDGSHALAVRIINSSGAVVATQQSQTLVIDTVAPSETITLTSVGGDTGGANGYTVSTGTPTFVGKLDGALLLANNSNGVTAEALFISLDNGQNWQRVTVNGTDWSFTPTTSLQNGQTYHVKMTVADLAGNFITDPSKTVDVNVTVNGSPDALQIKGVNPDTMVSDDGSNTGGAYGSATDFITNANGAAKALTVYGSLAEVGLLANGGKLQVSTDGTKWSEASVDSTGSWTYTFTDKLDDGTYTLQVRVVNAAGGEALKNSHLLTIDTTAPTEIADLKDISNSTQPAGATSSWYTADGNTRPTFSGTLSGGTLADGTTNGVTSEQLQIGLKDNGSPTSKWVWASVNITSNGTGWNYTPATDLGDGVTYDVALRVVDKAGNIKLEDGAYSVAISGGNGVSWIIEPPAVAPSTDLVPAPDVAIPAPPYADKDYMFRGSDPKFYLQLSKPLQTGYSVEIKVSNPDGTTILSYNSKDNASNFVFMGQSITSMPPERLNDGTYGLTATVYDSGGGVVTRSGTTLLVDTKPPAETASLTAISHDTGINASDFITNDPNQTFSGTLSAPLATGDTSGVSHEVLMINLINQSTGQSVLGGLKAASDSGTTWSFAPGFALYEGTYTVQLQVKDAAGNMTTLPPDSQKVVIDRTAPVDAQLVQTGGNYFTVAPSDSGASVNGLVTSGTHLTFSGSYTGSLADGSQSGVSAERIEVNVGDGTGWHMAAVNADAKTWTLNYTSTNLPVGTYNVQVQVADAAGNATQPVGNSVTINTSPPAETATITAISPDSYGAWEAPASPAASDFITNPGNSILVLTGAFSGALQSGETLRVSLDGNPIASQNTANNGWAALLPHLDDGSHTVLAQVISAAGVAGASDSKTLLIDTIRPDEVVSFATIGGQAVGSGSLATGNNGSSGAPLAITGTLNAALNGKGGSTESLQISLDGGGTWATVTAFSDPTHWSYNAPSTINDGNYIFMARVVDVAGNISPDNDIAKQPVIIENHPSNTTATITTISPDTSSVGPSHPAVGSTSDFITSTANSDGKLIISGSTSAANANNGQKVQVSFDGGQHWADATWSGSSWSYTAALGDASGYNGVGTYSAQNVQVQVVNVANVAGTSAHSPHDIVVDNRAPEQDVTLTKIADGNGAEAVKQTDGSYIIANDTNLTFSGTLDQALSTGGNGISSETLWINLGDNTGWHQVTNVTGNSWSYTATTLPDNSNGAPYHFQLQVVDEAGNLGVISNSGSGNLIVALTPDGIPHITSISPDTWVSDGNYGNSSDFITSTTLNGGSGALTITGNLDEVLKTGETVQVRLTDGTHPTSWVTATANANDKSWSASISSVSDGTYTIEAMVKNAAGGTSEPVVHSLTVDNTAPDHQSAALVAVTGSTRPDDNLNRWITDDGNYRPTLSGTLNGTLADGTTPGVTSEQLQIGLQDTLDDTGKWVWNSVTITSDGSGWNYTPKVDLIDGGVYKVALRVVDLAGNIALEDGPTYSLTIGTNGISWVDPAPSIDLVPAPDPAALALPVTNASKGLFTDVAAGSTLALRLSDVLSESSGTVGTGGKPMAILGDATSTVQLDGSATLAATNWAVTGQQTVGGVTFDVYHNSTMGANTAADLLIQQGVHVI